MIAGRGERKRRRVVLLSRVRVHGAHGVVPFLGFVADDGTVLACQLFEAEDAGQGHIDALQVTAVNSEAGDHQRLHVVVEGGSVATAQCTSGIHHDVALADVSELLVAVTLLGGQSGGGRLLLNTAAAVIDLDEAGDTQ